MQNGCHSQRCLPLLLLLRAVVVATFSIVIVAVGVAALLLFIYAANLTQPLKNVRRQVKNATASRVDTSRRRR